MNPPRHPSLGDLLRLVDQAHVEQQLRGAPDGALEGRPDPGVREGGVLADEDGVLLGAVVGGQVQLLLADERARPRARLEAVVLPAVPVVVARPLLRRGVAVDLDHGALRVCHVLGLAHAAERARERAGFVGREQDAGPRAVDGVGRVAHAADAGDVGAAAAADDGRGEVLPEARLVVQGDLAGLLVVEGLDGAREEAGVGGQLPQAHLGEGHGDDGVVEVEAVERRAEGPVGAPGDGRLAGGLVVGELLDLLAEEGAVGDERCEGCGEAAQALVDGAPLGGREVDGVVQPFGVVAGSGNGLVGDIEVCLQLVA